MTEINMERQTKEVINRRIDDENVSATMSELHQRNIEASFKLLWRLMRHHGGKSHVDFRH